MAGEEVICECRAMFAAPVPAHFKWTRPPKAESTPTEPSLGQAAVPKGELPRETPLDALRKKLEPAARKLKGSVFNIETVDGWSWIGIFALACLYALIPLYFVRPAEFLMASSNWGESMAPAWLIWLGFVFDTASFVITAVLISGLIQLGRGKPHATHKLRLACLLFLTLYLVATVFGVMLRVEVLTGVSAEPDYLAGVDGLIEGFETLYAKLIICLGIPAVIFTWSRRLEGIELTDRSVV